MFVNKLDDLFDVAHADALNLISIEEDRLFLLAQREKGRRGCMGAVDVKLSTKEQRRKNREQREANLRMVEDKRSLTVASTSVQLTDSDESSSEDDDDELLMPSGPSAKKLCPRRPASIITTGVAAALDRTKTSDRNATYVLAAAAQSLGHNPADIAINRESIRKARRKNREKIAREIQESFAPNIPLAVHWDEKLLPALASKDKVDRLAVLVSGAGTMKLLGVPAINNGTGEAQAASVFTLLEEWKLTDSVKCMSFDTTASNSGLHAGACVLLEKKMKRKLLSLACRHHIHELIVAKVFGVLMDPSSGPNIKLFERFAESWRSIDTGCYESAMIETSTAAELEPWRDDLISFCHDQLKTLQPRDDYKELLNLALLFLGAADDRPHTIIAPGALHRARWMSKLIYSLKIYIFRSQFSLTGRELAGLRDFNIFVVRIYLKAWYSCQCPVLAPLNDLELLKQLQAYETNPSVSKAALHSFSGHLWYLSETLVGLSFFDSRVSDDTKVAMVAALQQSGPNDPPRRISWNEKRVPQIQLSDLVTANTTTLFDALDISKDFLQLHPSLWEKQEEFVMARCKIQQLKVVNDAAERGVALITAFNGVITKQEEQKQYLLQLVEKHRKEYPNSNKSTIVPELLN
jgi:hypothetical protein